MPAEGRRGPDDRAQVPRVGDPVQGHDQRLLAVLSPRGQVLGVRVGVRPDPEGEALVYRPAAEPVELLAAGLDHRDTAVRGDRDGLADPLVRIEPRPDMQSQHRHRGAQGFEHGVAPGDDLGRGACPASPGGRRPSCGAGWPAGRAAPSAPRGPSAPRHRPGPPPRPGAAPGDRDASARAGSGPCLPGSAGCCRRCRGAACRASMSRPGRGAGCRGRSPAELPARAARRVLDHDAGVDQSVPDRVGGRRSPCGPWPPGAGPGPRSPARR